jgi:hypothetical protein
LKRGLVVNERWDEEWAAAWELQPHLASLHTTAVLPSGQVVTSAAYGRSRSRNGSRILMAFETRSGQQSYTAAEVQYFVCVRQTAPAGGVEDSGAAPSNADNPAAAAEICMAVILCFKTRQPRDEPDLATIMLEAKEGDWERDSAGSLLLRAVPIDLIICPLHTHVRRPAAGQTLLSFVPVMGRSRRVICRSCG